MDLYAFDGNVLEHHNFMTLFHEIVEKRIDKPRRELIRLIKDIKGDVHEMINHCGQQLGVQKLYWSRNMVMQKNKYVYRKEIKVWP